MKAIFDMPIPVNKGASAPLHSLIVKNCIWDFTESHKLAFQNIKKLTTECPTLKITNQNNMRCIKYRMEATLEQCIDVWYPIAFASRTLGKSKRNYCQLEKETLSIVFACKNFIIFMESNF